MFDSIIHSLLESLAVLIGSGITAIIVQSIARLKIRLSAESEAALRTKVQNAIAYAEEYVEALVKKQMVKAQASATTKLNEAIGNLLSKVPGLNRSDAEKMITEELGKSPFGASADPAVSQ
jgi:hypothetical protein